MVSQEKKKPGEETIEDGSIGGLPSRKFRNSSSEAPPAAAAVPACAHTPNLHSGVPGGYISILCASAAASARFLM